MIIVTIAFETDLSEQDVYKVAEERLPLFREVPGLVQKYYVKGSQPNQYSGTYIWDSMQSFQNYRASELAATIPAAYQVKGQPKVEIGSLFTQLRG